jgi:hypothetical protein
MERYRISVPVRNTRPFKDLMSIVTISIVAYIIVLF